jgi:signal transduction histidine kinase/AraC-like DNA-binding protein/ABC-type xylose transport system substrate-binding protein/CheY-like chemotaxis protein
MMNSFSVIEKQKVGLAHLLKFTFFLFIAFFISACSKKSKEPDYIIGFSQCVGSDLWRKTMLDEMKMELSLHPGVKFVYSDANGNSKTQVKQVQAMLDQNIDLLIISPNEAKPLTPIVESAFSSGIPVIVIDRKTSSGLYTSYVGANNFEVGKMAGEYVGKSLQSGNVLEVMGLAGSSPAIERQRGFYEGLKEYGNIKIKVQVYGNWLKADAEQALLKNPDDLKDIDAVFAHNDMMALGVREIINKLNLNPKIKVVGVDALPGPRGGLQMVDSKNINASLLYPTGGKEAIRTAIDILDKAPFAKENILPTVVIDSSNVKLMQMQWDRIGSQQKDIERQQILLKEQQRIYNNQSFVLNIIVITLVLAVFFGGLAFHSLSVNRKINKSLEQKNLEILDQRNQLIEMSSKAEAATEAKLNFFTNISHEFRTPLTLILAPLEDLMQNAKIETLAARRLKLIHKNVARLLRLINQLIDYRKIEYDKLQIQASNNDIISFTRDILESFRDTASTRNIALQFISKEKELKAWFDVQMMDKVFFNLLSNAFKFTENNGRITVTISRDSSDQQLIIKVEDNGLGMTEECIQHAFELFYQDNPASYKGSGLGLALSKELIQLHQGNILLESKQWQGTTFTINLPLGAAHLKETEKVKVHAVKDILYDDLRMFAAEEAELPKHLDADIFNILKEQSVLIIEDNDDLRYYMEEKFSQYYEVFTAANGTEGINQAFEKVPDLIISDVVLPEYSGKELTVKLKSDIRTSHIPIILLTAQAAIEQQIEGIKNMADMYIIKPFNFGYLLENAHNLIKNRLLLKEHYTSEYLVDSKLPISKKLDKKFLNDFAGIVEKNLSNENFAVDDICKSIGISRVQLYRKVKALLGCGITTYILNRRLQKAKYLLLHENLTISEITYQVGFASPTYFSTVFKAQFDYTPSEFKKVKMGVKLI